MNHIEIQRFQSRLDALFQKAPVLDNDPEMGAEWAKYLCILTSAFIEQSVKLLYQDYVTRRSEQNVATFACRQLENFRNPKMEHIVKLAGSFCKRWSEDLDDHTQGELKDAVDSIVANRNSIAHGRNVGLTLARVRSYYEDALKVIRIISEQVNPTAFP